MNSKQWVYIYGQIKDYIKKHEGNLPDEKAVSDLWEIHDFIMDKIAHSDKTGEGTEEQLKKIFSSLFKAIHCLELEGKPI